MKIALLALALAACNPYLITESVAPPGRTARLDEVTNWLGVLKSYRLELSQGVALALTCTHAGPCEHVHATSDDPAIAEVRLASLGRLEASAMMTNAQTASALVVVGKKPGRTHVRVVAEEGIRDIAVTVVPTVVTANPAPRVATAR